MPSSLRPNSLAVLAIVAALAFGCEGDMADQPRYEPYEASTFFADGAASRPIPPNTVARGHLRADDHLYAGRVGEAVADEFPFEITEEWLLRGQQRYQIFCAVCHGATGDGNGMIVQRGFTRPPSFYPISAHAAESQVLYQRSQYLLGAPVGHFFDVITNGWGAMFSYNDRITTEDRWAIIMYIKALQLSQHAPIDELPAGVRQQLQETAP